MDRLKEDIRQKSGYNNYQDYLETMKVYGFYPLPEKEWNKRYVGKDEWKGKNKGQRYEHPSSL